jgi:hypothetical protein
LVAVTDWPTCTLFVFNVLMPVDPQSGAQELGAPN